MEVNVKVSRVAFVAALGIGCSARLSAQAPPAEQYRLEFEVRRWKPDVVSDMSIGENGTPGTSIRAMEDLGVDPERQTEYRGNVRLSRRFKIRGTGFKFDYDATATPGTAIAFAGTVFPDGTELTTHIELEHVRGGVEVELLSSRDGFLAVVADYSRLDLRPTLSSASTQEAFPGALRIDLLTVGLRARAYLTRSVVVTAEANGMQWDDKREVITDVEASALWNFGRNFAFSFGYRNFYNKLDTEDLRAVFRLRGTYFSVIGRF